MTLIENVKTTCYVCGTEYGGPVLMSSNSMMGKPNIKPLACPKCGAPDKRVHPQIHNGAISDFLIAIVDDKNSVASQISKYSRNNNEVDLWIKLMIDENLNQWLNSNEQQLKEAESEGDDKYISELKPQIEKINKLIELSKNGTLLPTINEIALKAKECLAEEISKYRS